MHIFITGASGYVGGVVTEHLVRAGHQVAALARSDQARERVEALGAKAVPGGLRDLDVLRAAAAGADAVVHTAVDYFDAGVADVERAAVRSMLDGLRQDGSFLYTSTGLVYADTHGVPADEERPVDPDSPQAFKIVGERQVLDAGHVAGTVIRAGLVHGRAGSGLLRAMVAFARQQGMTFYVGDGANTWSSVHVDDLAALYAAVLASEPPGTVVNAAVLASGLPGTVVNAADGEPVSMRGIAETVAATAGARAVSLTAEQAAEMMGPVAAVLTRPAPLDSAKARRLYGWQPARPHLLDELTSGSYATGTGGSGTAG